MTDDQVVKRYAPGELFGEIALLKHVVRAATVTAVGEGVRVWALSRLAFEKKLGGLSELKAEQYMMDPRTLIAKFYSKGDRRGPAGTRAEDAAMSRVPVSYPNYCGPLHLHLELLPAEPMWNQR